MPDPITAEPVARSALGPLARYEAESNDLLLEVDSAVHRMMLAFMQAADAAKRDIAALVDQATEDVKTQRARIQVELARTEAELRAVSSAPAPTVDSAALAAARATAEREAAALLEAARLRERDSVNRLEQTQRELTDIEAEARRQLEVVTEQPEPIDIVITGVDSYPAAARLVLALQQDPLTSSVVPTHFEPGRVSLRLDTVKRGLAERILQRLPGGVELVSHVSDQYTFQLVPPS